MTSDHSIAHPPVPFTQHFNFLELGRNFSFVSICRLIFSIHITVPDKLSDKGNTQF